MILFVISNSLYARPYDTVSPRLLRFIQNSANDWNWRMITNLPSSDFPDLKFCVIHPITSPLPYRNCSRSIPLFWPYEISNGRPFPPGTWRTFQAPSGMGKGCAPSEDPGSRCRPAFLNHFRSSILPWSLSSTSFWYSPFRPGPAPPESWSLLSFQETASR